jgi:hypothetical protein
LRRSGGWDAGGAAYEGVEGAVGLVGPLRLDVADTADGLRIAYQWPPDEQPPALLATSELVFWVTLARIATRYHVRPVRVTLPALPRDPASPNIWNCRIRSSIRDQLRRTGTSACGICPPAWCGSILLSAQRALAW